jgi:hypothetical protein
MAGLVLIELRVSIRTFAFFHENPICYSDCAARFVSFVTNIVPRRSKLRRQTTAHLTIMVPLQSKINDSAL